MRSPRFENKKVQEALNGSEKLKRKLKRKRALSEEELIGMINHLNKVADAANNDENEERLREALNYWEQVDPTLVSGVKV